MRDKGGETISFFLFNLILGLCFTILLTAPGIQFLDTHILGYPHDGFAHTWKMWWWHEALFQLHTSPADVSYINYPYAGFSPHLIASPLTKALALPIISWLGPLSTYNVLLLAALILSWPTAALLCYEISGNELGASIGGAIFAFYPNKIAHAVGGHLPQMFVFLFPLSMLLLYRAWRSPERYRNSILAGVSLGLSALVHIKHVALFIAPIVGLFFGFYALAERDRWHRDRLISMLIVLTVAALITTPFLAPLVVGRLEGQLGHFYAEGVIRHSADLTSFLVPPPEHPLYRNLKPLQSYSAQLAAEGWHENIFYLGLVASALSVLGVWKHRRREDMTFWLIVALAGMVLALGPFLKAGGDLVKLELNGDARYIPMPYYVLQSLPFYDWGRTPGRIVGMTMLAVAVLASCGVSVILSQCKRVYRVPVMLGLLTLVLVDSLFVWPWPLGDAQAPAFYHQIALDTQAYAILDLPLWEYRCERYQLYYATIHGHPIVGGSITRRPPEAEAAMRRVERLALSQPDAENASALADLGIRYVVLHKLCLEGELGERTASLTAQLGPPVYDDRWIRAFEVPGRPTVPPTWISER